MPSALTPPRSHCSAGRIQLSAATHSLLCLASEAAAAAAAAAAGDSNGTSAPSALCSSSHGEDWCPTGGVAVKGKGVMHTYLWSEAAAAAAGVRRYDDFSDVSAGTLVQVPATAAASAAPAASSALLAAEPLLSRPIAPTMASSDVDDVSAESAAARHAVDAAEDRSSHLGRPWWMGRSRRLDTSPDGRSCGQLSEVSSANWNDTSALTRLNVVPALTHALAGFDSRGSGGHGGGEGEIVFDSRSSGYGDDSRGNDIDSRGNDIESRGSGIDSRGNGLEGEFGVSGGPGLPFNGSGGEGAALRTAAGASSSLGLPPMANLGMAVHQGSGEAPLDGSQGLPSSPYDTLAMPESAAAVAPRTAHKQLTSPSDFVNLAAAFGSIGCYEGGQDPRLWAPPRGSGLHLQDEEVVVVHNDYGSGLGLPASQSSSTATLPLVVLPLIRSAPTTASANVTALMRAAPPSSRSAPTLILTGANPSLTALPAHSRGDERAAPLHHTPPPSRTPSGGFVSHRPASPFSPHTGGSALDALAQVNSTWSRIQPERGSSSSSESLTVAAAASMTLASSGGGSGAGIILPTTVSTNGSSRVNPPSVPRRPSTSSMSRFLVVGSDRTSSGQYPNHPPQQVRAEGRALSLK